MKFTEDSSLGCQIKSLFVSVDLYAYMYNFIHLGCTVMYSYSYTFIHLYDLLKIHNFNAIFVCKSIKRCL